MKTVPPIRIHALVDAPVNPKGAYVLYWMTAFRRASFNFALERAVEHARALDRPLVVLEALRVGYPFASDRLHRFVVEGMAANERAFAKSPVHYFPYVEPTPGAGKGLLQALARKACVVVGDDYPCFFLPRMRQAAARQVATSFELVDSNGLLPLRATERVFPTAFNFRLFLQKNLAPHLEALPAARPLAGRKLPTLASLPREVQRQWPRASAALLSGSPEAFAALPIDHRVPAALLRGGAEVAREKLERFVRTGLTQYPDQRNQPQQEGTSQLSPYLHFGQVSVHQVLESVAEAEGWTPKKLGKSNGGKREGWWKLSPPAEAFLDQVVTWRELGYNFCSKREDYDQYDSLPEWARRTLAEHEADPRPHLYTLGQLARGQTHDPLFNAAQGALVRDGWLHNYLRMLWGKKILEFSSTPRQALATMIGLMNRFSLDGRDPNSYTGYFWVLGRYDRPWGPERKIFGKIRYMSSANTARKVRVADYIARYAPEAPSR